MAAGEDLLETTHSETVPLLSDDLHGYARGRRYHERRLRRCGQAIATAGRGLEQLLALLCPFYAQVTRDSDGYTSKSLVSDLLTGLTMSVFHIPQGLAYGLLAGLKPINGLYTSLIPVSVYCLFGRSRHMSLGTFSLTSLLLADMISSSYQQYMYTRLGTNRTVGNATDASGYEANARNATTDDATDQEKRYLGGISAEEYAKLQVAILGSFAASLVNLLLGVLQLGFVMNYVSNSMLRGFTTAAAVHILTSQIPILLGLGETAGGNSVFKLVASFTGIVNNIGSTNGASVIIAVACMVLLYLLKEHLNPILQRRIKVPLPAELLIILLSLLASNALQLESRFNVPVVGSVPQGPPVPLLPDFAFLPSVLLSSLPVGLVGGAISLSITKMYALQFDYPVNYNGELFVLGLSSLFGSFFQSFYATGALARTAVVVSAGMRSQLASAVSCGMLLLIVLAVGPFLESVPNSALAAVIVVSLTGFFKQVADMPKLWRASNLVDLTVWLVTAAAVLVLNVSLGLAIGFGSSVVCSVAVQLAGALRKRRDRLSTGLMSTDLADAAARYPMMIGPKRPSR